MHVDLVDGEEEPEKPSKVSKEHSSTSESKDSYIIVKCTELCNFPGSSCAKMVLVNIFPEGDPTKAIKTYAIVDDQSNRSLAKPAIFDQFNINCERTEYTFT